MEPTVLVGDRLLVDKSAYGLRVSPLGSGTGRRGLNRADLAAFLFPEDRSRVFLKRVIGLPGERVEVRGEAVYINGTPLKEPYAFFTELSEHAPRRSDWGPDTVPAGHVFVLGDNRHNSRDSRFWGFVPITDIVGAPKIVYFSWDPKARRVRWERIGRRLR